MTSPPQVVIDALASSVSQLTTRADIYESDGTTPWDVTQGSERVVDGSISVDYSRDERRTLDLTLDNYDGALKSDPGAFWYDKIIKVYKGVVVNEQSRPPRTVIVGDYSSSKNLATKMRELGFTDVALMPTLTTVEPVADREIAIFIATNDGNDGVSSAMQTLAKALYDNGMSVLTIGLNTAISGFTIPFINGSSSVAAPGTLNIAPNFSVADKRLITGWSAFTYSFTSRVLCATSFLSEQGAFAVSTLDDYHYAVIGAVNPTNDSGKWVHMQLPALYAESNFNGLLNAVLDWLNPFSPISTWETQVGEFMIDNIEEDDSPKQSHIVGRDYTKKCMLSKYSVATEFDAPASLESLISSIASNAGINKIAMPATGETIDQSFTYERDSPRWDSMKAMANAYNFDVSFSSSGFLQLVKFYDPTTSRPSMVFSTGKFGNLASYQKTNDDSQLFNHILVVGAADPTTQISPYAESINNDPLSPTSIQKVGDRLYEYDSDFIASTDQAQSVADSFLASHTLEQYSLNFSAINMFFLEVGEIIQFDDPRRAASDPTTFLLQTLTIPLLYGPMTATAARLLSVI